MSGEAVLPVIDVFGSKAVADLIGDPRPIWVWSADGRRIVWANMAGVEKLGFADLAEARARLLANDSAASHLARIASAAAGIPTMARLRYFRGMKPVNIMASCRVLTLAEGSTILLGVGLESAPGALAAEGDRIRSEIMALGETAGPRVLLGPQGDVVVAGADPVFRSAIEDALEAGPDALARLREMPLAGVRHHMNVLPLAGGYRLIVPGAEVLESSGNLVHREAPCRRDTGNDRRFTTATGAALAGDGGPTPGGNGDRGNHIGKPDGASNDTSSPPDKDKPRIAIASEAAMTDTPNDDATPSFSFRRQNRPARFVWQMDAETRFTDISDELAAAVGPTAGNLVGRRWAEVAENLGLDPEGKVARALARCDTWSGLTVYWPVAGTDLAAPVDLAALPAFGRKRTFEGYRGFGVCRTLDAVPNPNPVVPAAPATAEAPASQDAAAAGILSGAAVAAASVAEEPQADVPAVADMPANAVASEEAAAPETVDAEPEHDTGAEAPSGDVTTETEGSVDEAPVPTAESPLDENPSDEETASPVEPQPSPEHDARHASSRDMPADTFTDSGFGSKTNHKDDGAAPGDETVSASPDETEPPAAVEAQPAHDVPAEDSSIPVEQRAAENEPAMAKIAEILHRTEAEAEAEAAQHPGAEEPTESDTTEAEETPVAETASGDATPADSTAAPDTPAEAARPEETGPMEPQPLFALPGSTTKAIADRHDLSRPEREAFRLIADLLGARLEGDDESEEPAERREKTSAEDFEDKVVPLPSAFAAGKPQPIDPTLLDRLPIGVLIARDHDVLYLNQPMLDLIGYPSAAALATAGGLEALFVDPEEWETAEAEKRAEGDRTLPIRRRDGDKITVTARLHAVPWNDGSALMMSFQPIPAAKEEPASDALPPMAAALADDMAALSYRIEELETVVDTATDGILMLDGDGVILGVNRSAEALFGSERSDMIGQTLHSYLAPESRRSARDYLDGLAANGVASVLNDGREVIGEVAGGGLIPLFMTIGRVGEASGNKFCAVLRDITQLKRAEEELTTTRRKADGVSTEKSELLGKISHEVRTPLNAIIGFSEVMMEERFGPVGNERYREYLRDIHSSGSLILNLIDDLVDLTRIEAGNLDLAFEAVSANDVIRECVALTQPRANRERVIIRTSLSSAVPRIVADGRSLHQIILNLLSNAINFNISGGQVIVSTVLEDNGEVVIRVRDTGIGISDKDMAVAMEPFRQVHASRRGSGTGLGLPLTKALAEANRATFSIDSEVGRGTLVQIAFPTTRVLAE